MPAHLPLSEMWSAATKQPLKHFGDLSNSTVNANSVAGSQNAYINGKSSIPLFKTTPRKRLEVILLALAALTLLLLISLFITTYFLVAGKKNSVCSSPQCIRSAANYMQSMDEEVRPCDNFYKYVCGQWKDEHDLRDPGLYNDWFTDRGWSHLRSIKGFLNQNDSESEPLPVHQARALYRGCQDYDAMEKTGFETLAALLEEIGLSAFPPINGTGMRWMEHLARAERLVGVNPLFEFGLTLEPTNRTVHKLSLSVPGDELLPSMRKVRSGQVGKEEARMKAALDSANESTMRQMRMSLVEAMLYMVGAAGQDPDHHRQHLHHMAANLSLFLKSITSLEMNQNITSIPSGETPDELTLNELQETVDSTSANNNSKINWETYFTVMYENTTSVDLDLNGHDTILVYKKLYFEMLSPLLDEVDDVLIDLAIWWKVVYYLASHTNEELEALKESYLSKVLHSPSSKTRATFCAETTYSLMDFAVGYKVLSHKDLEKKKKKVEEMVEDIMEVYKEQMKKLTWMDSMTKEAVLDKVAAMRKAISYPQWYLDPEQLEQYYENITIDEEYHLQNVLSIISTQNAEQLTYLREAYVSDNISFDPLDINAYYSFADNYIIIPEGVLRHPFYNLGLEALNYGALGVILGHEFTHGFDNTGRKYDKEGNLRPWWSNSSEEAYNTRTECYVQQYNNIQIDPDTVFQVDGTLTLGENLADNGGVRQAFSAYQAWEKRHGTETRLAGMESFSPHQLFFIAFANMWCSEFTEDGLLMYLIDDHAPHFIRVIGALQNSREFSEAFSCPSGSVMNPSHKCRLWSS